MDAKTDYSGWLTDVLDRRAGFEHEVVDRYAHRLIAVARKELPHRLTRRVDAEDIVQSVFRSFFRRFDEGEYSFDNENNLWQLLVTITYHKSITAVRHHGRQRRDFGRDHANESTIDVTQKLPSVEPTSDDVVVMLDLLDRLLEQLPERSRQIVCMRLEDYSIAEIACTSGVSQRTVLRALKRVRDVARELAELSISPPPELA